MQSLFRTRPENLKDLTIQVAIVRPGPIQGGAVNPYIERRQRLRVDPDYQVPYEHPSLEPALRETLGAIIFQDQVIEVAIAFAGFSPGEAEGLRRAMSRKRSDAAIEAYHQRFVAGASRRHGVDEETAERVFAMVRGFSGFGFPKAHGAAFGLLAYQSTWLRVHYGPEFLCSLLNEQPMGFYPPDALVHEAQRRGIEVLAPDVNESDAECGIEREDASVASGSASATSAVSPSRRSRSWSRRARRRAVPEPRRSRLARGLERRLAGAARLVGGVRLASCRVRCPGRLGLGAAHGAVAARGGDARAAGCPAGCSWRSRWICPRRRELRALSDVGVDARRLRHHRDDRRRASDRAAARPAARRAWSAAATLRTLRHGTRVGWAGWWWRASAPARPTGSCSCCSRTSSGRST